MKIRANVKMINYRQVDIEVKDMNNLIPAVIKAAKAEFGSCDSVELDNYEVIKTCDCPKIDGVVYHVLGCFIGFLESEYRWPNPSSR